jgi:hypothetical protein
MTEPKATRPLTLYDVATDNRNTPKGLTLEEALAQVDVFWNGDEELKALIRAGYSMKPPSASFQEE